MRTILISLLFITASCSKSETPKAPDKTCYNVTRKVADAIALRYFIYYGTQQVEVSGAVFNQYEVGQPICFDKNNNIVK